MLFKAKRNSLKEIIEVQVQWEGRVLVRCQSALFKLSLNCFMLEQLTTYLGTGKVLLKVHVKVLGLRKNWAVWSERPNSMLSTSSSVNTSKH